MIPAFTEILIVIPDTEDIEMYVCCTGRRQREGLHLKPLSYIAAVHAGLAMRQKIRTAFA